MFPPTFAGAFAGAFSSSESLESSLLLDAALAAAAAALAGATLAAKTNITEKCNLIMLWEFSEWHITDRIQSHQIYYYYLQGLPLRVFQQLLHPRCLSLHWSSLHQVLLSWLMDHLKFHPR